MKQPLRMYSRRPENKKKNASEKYDVTPVILAIHVKLGLSIVHLPSTTSHVRFDIFFF